MDKGVKFYKTPHSLPQWNEHKTRLSRTDRNYSEEVFYQVKYFYLTKWVSRAIDKNKKIVVCGSSKICRKKTQLLEANGLSIYGYTDVKPSRNKNIRFISIEELNQPNDWFLINMISRRGVGPSIRKHFSNLGFADGRDFILAG